jgi:hypothetical protein
MRIALTSDLHVDHHPEVIPLVAERARRLEAEVLIVAGDLSSSLEHLERALAGLREASGARRALFVPGNHDLWCTAGGPSSRARYHELIPACARSAGFDPLGHQPIAIDSPAGPIHFAGVTGWYDFSLRNRELDATFTPEDYRRGAFGPLRWNDTARVVWPDDEGHPLEAPAICAAQVANLQAQLASIAGAPSVVVTHHLPFSELVTYRDPNPPSGTPRAGRDLPWDFLNGFMGSAALGEAILAAPGVRLVCSGHTHFRKSARLKGASGPVRAEVSPVGYPREYARAGLDLAARVAERVTLIDLPS